MHTLNIVPGFIAEDVRKMNPGRRTPDEFGVRINYGLFSKAEYPLGELVGEGADIKGYKAVKRRLDRSVSVQDAEGNAMYCGPHERIEGIFMPEPRERTIFGRANPAVVREPLIAFRDGNEVNVFSTESKCYKWFPDGAERPLFGAPFDEVHPFDILVPVAEVSMSFSLPDYRYADVLRYLLGRKGDTWMLNDFMGETAVESPSKEALKGIFMATSTSTVFDGRLTFYALEDAEMSE